MLIANYDFEIDKKVYAEEAAEIAAEKAYADGMLEGESKGENKRARYVALNMLKDGLPIEKVAEYSGLSVEQIKALQ